MVSYYYVKKDKKKIYNELLVSMSHLFILMEWNFVDKIKYEEIKTKKRTKV